MTDAMKKIILLLLVTLAFGACKKVENDVEPQGVAEAVAGKYTLNSFRYAAGSDVINLPKMPYTQNGQTISGTVELRPTSDNDVRLTLTLNVTGQQPESIDIDQVEVKQRGKVYGLYVDGDLVADADGKSLIFNLSETAQSGETLELKFVAAK